MSSGVTTTLGSSTALGTSSFGPDSSVLSRGRDGSMLSQTHQQQERERRRRRSNSTSFAEGAAGPGSKPWVPAGRRDSFEFAESEPAAQHAGAAHRRSESRRGSLSAQDSDRSAIEIEERRLDAISLGLAGANRAAAEMMAAMHDHALDRGDQPHAAEPWRVSRGEVTLVGGTRRDSEGGGGDEAARLWTPAVVAGTFVGTEVAVTVHRGSPCGTYDRRAFVAKCRALVRLCHRSLAPLLGAVPARGLEITPAIDGETLAFGDPDPYPALADVASLLSYLHASEPPIVHGGIRAGSVLVTGDGALVRGGWMGGGGSVSSVFCFLCAFFYLLLIFFLKKHLCHLLGCTVALCGRRRSPTTCTCSRCWCCKS
jgi:hypothetical protein